MTKKQALEEANQILRDEANELATLNKEGMTHRAKVALRRELERLRTIAATICPDCP